VYRPEEEGGIAWDDPGIGIEWPVERPVLSDKDRQNPRLADIDRGRLITTAESERLRSSA
jgi:dTDP-4-dehydrorhamnose 3,5-epimerase